MSTETVRLNITLPASIAEELNRISAPRKRSHFIAEAIKLRINQLNDEKMRSLMIEGYGREKEQGLEITKEFEAADIENWDEY